MPTIFPFRILQEHAEKPRFGEPCNNCGLCCRVQACHVSKTILHSEQAPCIALEIEDGKFYCGVVRRPMHYLKDHVDAEIIAPQIKRYLDIGWGCTMDDVVAVTTQEPSENRD